MEDLGLRLEGVLAKSDIAPLVECGLIALLRVFEVDWGALYLVGRDGSTLRAAARQLPEALELLGHARFSGGSDVLSRAAAVRGAEVLTVFEGPEDPCGSALIGAGIQHIAVGNIPALLSAGGFVLVCLPESRVLSHPEMKTLQWVSTLMGYSLAQAAPKPIATLRARAVERAALPSHAAVA
jgi:hypothetical protein